MRMNKGNLIALGVAVAMTLAALVGVYLPQERRLGQLKAQMASEQSSLESDSQKIAVVPELSRQVQAMKNRYRDFDRKMPKSQDLHEFLRQINASLTAASLTNQSTDWGIPVRDQHISTLPINMKFQGSFLSLASFMDRLDKLERLSRVQKLIISGEEKGGDLGIELQMAIYFTES